MNKSTDFATFQADLTQYINIYTPNHWPIWLSLAGLLLVGMFGAFVLHFMLRAKFGKKTKPDPEVKIYLYSAAVRLWHWSNAALFMLLLFSGLINHFALLSASATATLVGLHKVCGFLLIACWVVMLLINLFGGNGKHYRIHCAGFVTKVFKQAKYYMVDIVRGGEAPFPATEQSKFNPLQQVTYIGVLYGLIPLLILTGLLALNPTWIPALKPWTLTLHLLLAVGGLFFIAGHLYMCTTGRTPLRTFRAMIDGYHRH